ncbi:beta-galactosidase/beta-glucuronidase [Terriglobus roseus DSM 18391]|uniref:Beta-galactosidase/beta-glucuronidase n=1 Tax=Terriglobus roseus (strain DSM 18391 / NRRL B-41598 / KBS 63) TaxID=926566 RepID=I3ZE66_TERRK|nr:glycoside hydrolase family 2 TIM barrel-domain containing protein [Terriglobus roseus]AFL87534.1 beta-galactosidase/beta-glucuronidase [Terriglobus roseus DSM 18391]
MTPTRRAFLVGSAALCATTLVSSRLMAASTTTTPDVTILDKDWEFYRGPLEPWQVWHSEELVTWEPQTVPHCFNHYDACDPDIPAYRGSGWYRTKLKAANPYRDGRTMLLFEGAAQTSEVFMGTTSVGKHIGGYNEFAVDITDALKTSKDGALAIHCSNARDLDRMPSDLSDFTLYGGLIRPVHLVYLPELAIESIYSVPEWHPGDTSATVSVTARLSGNTTRTASQIPFTIKLIDSSGKVVTQQKLSKNAGQAEFELATLTIPAVQPWSPETPTLYRCEVTMGTGADTSVTTHRFGIRHTKFEAQGPFLLNGKRLLLRGTHRHEDGAYYAAAMPADQVREEFRLIKAMGANFIRLAHYQQSRQVLDLCDELGLLVWEEVPWCRSGVGSATFQQHGKDTLTAMIDQHRNHPSVLMWGLGNEDDWPGELNGDDREAIRTYMRELHELSHKLDPSRVTSYRRCDFARDIPDVYSPSIWAGWYGGRYTEYAAALEKARKAVPHFIHMEWGADSHAGRHAEDPDPALGTVATGKGTAEKGFDYKLTGGTQRMAKDGEWSETYACDLFDWYLKTSESTPWLTGTAQWVFKDFTTPLRVENPVPRVNQKGLITRDMQLKEGYYVFQSFWAKEPMLRLYGHSFPLRWGKARQKRTARVYSNCSEVELFLNGKSVGRRKRDPNDFPCAGLRWELAFTEGRNELRAVAHEGGKTLEDTVQFRYETRPWSKPVKLLLRTVATQNGRSTVEAELVDVAGVRCLDSRAVVRFSLAGDGRLIDNLGTPDGSRVVQLANGRARITVDHREAVVVGVSSDNIIPGYQELGKHNGQA